jgi:hypothetical protein
MERFNMSLFIGLHIGAHVVGKILTDQGHVGMGIKNDCQSSDSQPDHQLPFFGHFCMGLESDFQGQMAGNPTHGLAHMPVFDIGTGIGMKSERHGAQGLVPGVLNPDVAVDDSVGSHEKSGKFQFGIGLWGRTVVPGNDILSTGERVVHYESTVKPFNESVKPFIYIKTVSIMPGIVSIMPGMEVLSPAKVAYNFFPLSVGRLWLAGNMHPETALRRRLAKAMGVKFVPVNTTWDGIILALITDKFDISMGGMTHHSGDQYTKYNRWVVIFCMLNLESYCNNKNIN